jgi:hypothetical protein
MSEPVELSFRQRLAAAFASELGDRVYDLVQPPDAAKPLALYRRVGADESGDSQNLRARIQVTVKDDSYTDAKRLQKRIEGYMRTIRGEWLAGAGEECPVWVYQVKPVTMPDVYQPSTRMRLAVSDFIIHYADTA